MAATPPEPAGQYVRPLARAARRMHPQAVQLNHAAMVLPAFQTIARNEQARKPDEPVEIFVKWGRHLAEGAVRHDKVGTIPPSAYLCMCVCVCVAIGGRLACACTTAQKGL